MTEYTYDELQTQLQKYYADGEFQKAYDLATHQIDRFPEHTPMVSYWRSTMAARLDEHELAIQILRELQNTGFWFGEALLRQSPSYQDLQGNPAFEKLIVSNRDLQEQEEEKILHLLTIRGEDRCVNEDDPCSLLIGLHANASNAQDSIKFWRSLGCLLSGRSRKS